jgi:EamA-like transporter family
MSLAPSVAVPRSSFNPLPLHIALFCLLWSFAFVAGKIGVTDCPPLILLTARFSLAGILILGISAIRGEAWSLSWRDAATFAVLGLANNALYLGLGYTEDGLRRHRRPDRLRQSGRCWPHWCLTRR